MPAEMLEDRADQRDGRVGIVQYQLGEQAAFLTGEFFPQPAIHYLDEGELRLVAVHHGGAGVDVGLDRIGHDEPLAEAVDGRAGHLVERRVGLGEVATLLFRQAVRQGGVKLDRDIFGRKRAHEGPHPNEQLACGELGERHGGNGVGRDPSGQQHGDAARQNCGFARSRAGLHQERAVADRDGLAPRGIVGENQRSGRHHGASHTRVASPRSAFAATSFRTR